jgi:uncharacterized membrane protein
MEFIILIAVVIFVFNLRSRVERLEEFIKSSAFKRAPDRMPEPIYQSQILSQFQPQSQPQPQQLEPQQPATPVALLDYIKQQLRQGVSREAIVIYLTSVGWQSSDIEKSFSSITSSAESVMLPVGPLQAEPDSFEKFISWAKEDWLLKLGALLLLIGFGWLTTYAFTHDWIGATGRITIGIVSGTLFMMFGWKRMEKYINQGSIFLVLGSTVVLLTIFAARSYGYFTPLSALVIMFLSTAFVALTSVKYNNRSLALLSLVLAGIAPLLTNGSASNTIGLFSYLFVVVLGAIWIVALTGMRELTMAALLLIAFYSFPHFFSPDKGTLLVFAYAFATVFFLTNTIGILKSKGKEIVSDLITAAGNGLLLLAWIMMAAPEEWKSLIIAAWMVVFAAGAFSIFRVTQRKEPFYVYAGVCIAMLAAATSIELEGSALTIAYTIEGGIIPLITYFVLQDVKVAERMSSLLVLPVFLSVGSIFSNEWGRSVFNEDFFVLLILGLTFLGLGLFFLQPVRESKDEELQQGNAILLTAGSIYMYVLLWLSLHAGLGDGPTAVMISLAIYTIIGLIFYFHGISNDKRTVRLYGGALVGLVVIRLLLVDIWEMEMGGKIITFFLIGVLLMSTAFLGKKQRDSNLLNNTQKN